MSVELIAYAAFFLTGGADLRDAWRLGLNVQWGQTGLFNVGVAASVAIAPMSPGAAHHARRCEPSWRLRLADGGRLAGRRAGLRAGVLSDRCAHYVRLRADYPGHRHLRRCDDGATRRAEPRTNHRRTVRHPAVPSRAGRASPAVQPLNFGLLAAVVRVSIWRWSVTRKPVGGAARHPRG